VGLLVGGGDLKVARRVLFQQRVFGPALATCGRELVALLERGGKCKWTSCGKMSRSRVEYGVR
jgi:hypothetical protein